MPNRYVYNGHTYVYRVASLFINCFEVWNRYANMPKLIKRAKRSVVSEGLNETLVKEKLSF